MRIRLCPFRLPSRPRQIPRIPDSSPRRGQVIVIFAVTLLALLFFSGLAIDAGSLYVTYGQLRRGIDAAAVAASNEYKAEGVKTVSDPLKPPPFERMRRAAVEVMKLNNLNMDYAVNSTEFRLFVCDKDGNSLRDDPTATGMPDDFYKQCPDTSLGLDGLPKENDRKLVWIEALQKAPLYFLSLLGFQNVPLRAHAIAEAAPIDLVIVIDTSESMTNGVDPAVCNPLNTCEPLLSAKNGATALINTLYDGYDHVAVVNYDVTAPDPDTIPMRIKLNDAVDDIGNLEAHDDAPWTLIRDAWYTGSLVDVGGLPTQGFKFNPIYPEDRDADEHEADSPACTWDEYLRNTADLTQPCDDPAKFDAYDWDENGFYSDADDTASRAWLTANGCDPDDPENCDPKVWTNFSITSTCTGCGFKAAAEVLKQNGRPNSVWVIVLLSDGLVNMSETSVAYPYGHCNGGLGSFMWSNACIDSRKQWKHIQHDNSIPADGDYTDPGDIDYWGFGDTRFCHPDRVADNNCAPDSRDPNSDLVHHPLEFYSVYDWTLDQVDAFALLKSTNDDEEITGSDVAVYTIGLGDAGLSAPGFGSATAYGERPIGEYLLRYMAAVGDDGYRDTDECSHNPATSLPYATNDPCGQYYYSSDGSDLHSIFNKISTRIYTRLTK